jgi:hypothetical protein
MLSNSSSNLPFYTGGSGTSSNQIVNGGQHGKELNYITTEYVKDKNLLENRKSSSGSGNNVQHHRNAQQQQHYHQQRQQRVNNTR